MSALNGYRTFAAGMRLYSKGTGHQYWSTFHLFRDMPRQRGSPLVIRVIKICTKDRTCNNSFSGYLSFHIKFSSSRVEAWWWQQSNLREFLCWSVFWPRLPVGPFYYYTLVCRYNQDLLVTTVVLIRVIFTVQYYFRPYSTAMFQQSQQPWLRLVVWSWILGVWTDSDKRNLYISSTVHLLRLQHSAVPGGTVRENSFLLFSHRFPVYYHSKIL